MSISIGVKAIKPKDLNVAAFERAVERGLDSGAKTVKASFEETMTTFRRKFPVKINSKTGFRFIWVDGEIYSYVSEGTSIRWALMSRDWRSKTRPGRIPPGAGRGRVVIAGRRAMMARGIQPRRGIEGRKFDKQIAKRDAPGVQRGLDREIARAAAQAF
jgi:hypothetical protein